MTKLKAHEVDEFWHRIESYVQAVAAALESRIGAEGANEQVIQHLVFRHKHVNPKSLRV